MPNIGTRIVYPKLQVNALQTGKLIQHTTSIHVTFGAPDKTLRSSARARRHERLERLAEPSFAGRAEVWLACAVQLCPGTRDEQRGERVSDGGRELCVEGDGCVFCAP